LNDETEVVACAQATRTVLLQWRSVTSRRAALSLRPARLDFAEQLERFIRVCAAFVQPMHEPRLSPRGHARLTEERVHSPGETGAGSPEELVCRGVLPVAEERIQGELEHTIRIELGDPRDETPDDVILGGAEMIQKPFEQVELPATELLDVELLRLLPRR